MMYLSDDMTEQELRDAAAEQRSAQSIGTWASEYAHAKYPELAEWQSKLPRLEDVLAQVIAELRVGS